MLGSCYKLVGEKRNVFIRILMLFGLHNTLGDDEAYGQQLMSVWDFCYFLNADLSDRLFKFYLEL